MLNGNVLERLGQLCLLSIGTLSLVFMLPIQLQTKLSNTRCCCCPRMANTVYISFLPLTVLCAVLGLPIAVSHRHLILFQVYSWTVTVLYCATCMLGIFMSVYAVEFTYISVMTSIGGDIFLFATMYYRIKYILFDEGNLLDNIHYLDKKLESLNMRIPHGRNCILAATYTVIYLSLNMIMNYKNFRYMELPQATKSLSVLGSTCFIILSAVTYMHDSIINIRLFLLMYFFQQRLNLIRKAIVNHSRSNIAWSEHRVGTLSANICSNDDTNYFQTITSLYRCSFDIYRNITSFYASFLNTNVFILCTVYPVQLVFNIIRRDDVSYGLIIFVFRLIQHLSFVECVSVTDQLDRLHCAVHRLWYRRSIQRLHRQEMNYWLLECGHYDSKFDCGFLDVDAALFSVIPDYILPFVFAILPSVYY